MNEKLEVNLKKLIKDGETILWQGQPTKDAKALLKKDLKDNTLYVITNKRVLTIRPKYNKYSEVRVNVINKAKFVTDSEGTTSFVVGFRTINLDPKDLAAVSTVEPRFDGAYLDCEAFVQYAIPDQKGYEEAIRKVAKF